MFAELHLPVGIPVDRDEVEDAVGAAIEGSGEVAGAGTGVYGSNLDLVLYDDADVPGLLAALGELVAAFGIVGARVRSKGRRPGRHSRPAYGPPRLDPRGPGGAG